MNTEGKMKVYLPIKKEDALYVADTSHVDISIWRDADYLEFFENEINASHKTGSATVSIYGTEFKSCEILVPINDALDHNYVAVDEDYVPLSFKDTTETIKNLSPNENWVIRWLSKSKNSDFFYKNYFVDLSTKYIAPRVIWDDDRCTQIYHPDSIRRGSRILLTGQPGSGKTSFVRYMTQYYLRNISDGNKNSETPVVFYSQLREFDSKLNEIQSWLVKEQEKADTAYVDEKDKAGKILFIFDGLDELNEDGRQNFTGWLEKFISTRKSHSTIVTSRKLKSLNSGIWKSFKKVEILPFESHQVDEYCKAVIENKEQSDQFLRVIKSNPDLLKFLANPFSLSLALGMFLFRGTLPFNIGVLCREIVAQLVERWDARRGINRGTEISIESINSTLGRLAFRLQSKGNAQFCPNFLEDLLPVEITKIGALEVLQNLSERTGIVLEVRPGIWSFSHRYLQDFFCANYLVEKAGGLNKEFDEHGRDFKWVGVWRQVGQLCQDPEFFAMSESRNASDSIKSIDRMVSCLLSHDGLSKEELTKIIDGLTDELNLEKSELPKIKYFDSGAELDCNKFDNESIEILAKTMIHLDYLKETIAGALLKKNLENNSKNDFAIFTHRILRNPNKSGLKVGVSGLQITFNSEK